MITKMVLSSACNPGTESQTLHAADVFAQQVVVVSFMHFCSIDMAWILTIMAASPAPCDAV